MQKNLQEILNNLKSGSRTGKIHIYNSWNYPDASRPDRQGLTEVNAAEYFAGCIEYIRAKDWGGAPAKTGVVYSMLPRTFSALFDGQKIVPGSLLRSLCLLPLLKRLHVDTLYLLPVFASSGAYKKGGLPSPYAIRDWMSVDPALHDSVLDGLSVEIQFAAFVEAAHHMGFKVILDFVFRTAARDHVLADERPDWFYWIKAGHADSFGAPGIPGLPHSVVDERNVDRLYESADMRNFANSFAPAPDMATVRALQRESPLPLRRHPPFNKGGGEVAGDGRKSDWMTLLREREGLITMPGFADTINDAQPPWTDVTFLRFYLDNTAPARKYFGESAAPFIAQDGVKCSRFPGQRPNYPLWEYLKGIIPYYIERFHIDGARIDMAHALPAELARDILAAARRSDPEFILWSEEFNCEHSAGLKREGYDFLTGDIFGIWNMLHDGGFGEKLLTSAGSAIPSTAALETADTPRIALNLNYDDLFAATWICALFCNSVFLINSGQELGEIQPMNLGLNNTDAGRLVLPKDDPRYGKLAFFDNTYFDWGKLGNPPCPAGHPPFNKGGKEIFDVIALAAKIKKDYKDLLTCENLDKKLFSNGEPLLQMVYRDEKEALFLFFNRGESPLPLRRHPPFNKGGKELDGFEIIAANKGSLERIEPNGTVVLKYTRCNHE